MKLNYCILFFIYHILLVSSCKCAQSNLSYHIYDVSTNLNYSSEWWYFLLNMVDPESPIVSSEIIWLRYSTKCNKKSIFIYQHSNLYKNGSFYKDQKAVIQDSNSGENFFKVDNYKISWNRENQYRINIQGMDNFTLSGYGYPQGINKNGFVKTGEQSCDSSYALSFMDLKGFYGNHSIRGYGEHVLTSTTSQKSPYIGWNCHYFHSLNTYSVLSNYFLCQSKFKDSKISDPYQRAMILYNNYTIWTSNFKITALNSWKSPYSNVTYPTYWYITFLNYDMDHYFIPDLQYQEVSSGKNGNFWDGSSIVVNNNGNIIGYGFNEIFKLIG